MKSSDVGQKTLGNEIETGGEFLDGLQRENGLERAELELGA